MPQAAGLPATHLIHLLCSSLQVARGDHCTLQLLLEGAGNQPQGWGTLLVLSLLLTLSELARLASLPCEGGMYVAPTAAAYAAACSERGADLALD
jgi:hypothetical protein